MLEVPGPGKKVHPGLSQRGQVELQPGLSRRYHVAALAVMNLLFCSAVAIVYPCPATNGRFFSIMILGPVSLHELSNLSNCHVRVQPGSPPVSSWWAGLLCHSKLDLRTKSPLQPLLNVFHSVLQNQSLLVERESKFRSVSTFKKIFSELKLAVLKI